MSLDLPYQDKSSSWSSHTLIAAILDGLPSGSRIFDVGVASGTLARMCKDRAFRFFGVEPNLSWAKMAEPLYEKIWVNTIEHLDESILGGYQAVVLGDVLEHTSSPEIILSKIVTRQEPNCLFVISVPNIANLWIRLNLLFGRFDYTERGILDRTHLRFFTRKTLMEMVNVSGLKIVSIQVTPIPLELISKFFVSSPGRLVYFVFAWITKLFPTLLGYQFIVVAKKHETQ